MQLADRKQSFDLELFCGYTKFSPYFWQAVGRVFKVTLDKQTSGSAGDDEANGICGMRFCCIFWILVGCLFCTCLLFIFLVRAAVKSCC